MGHAPSTPHSTPHASLRARLHCTPNAPLARRAPQSNPASYVSQISDEQPMRVTKDSEVRLRIMGTRVDATEIFAIGTIKDEYLGLLQ